MQNVTALDKEIIQCRNKELFYLLSIYKNAVSYSSLNESIINKVCKNLCSFERPDIISIFDDQVYAFEHFEFDFYKNNKDGSSYETERADDDLMINKAINRGELINKSKKINAKASEESLIINFLKMFDNHYNRINSYKERLDSYFGLKEKHIWFIAEMKSPMWCIAQTQNGVDEIHPLMFKKVYEVMKKSVEIEGLILVNEGKFIVIPSRDYSKANRNYDENSVKLELTNPMEYIVLYKIK